MKRKFTLIDLAEAFIIGFFVSMLIGYLMIR